MVCIYNRLERVFHNSQINRYLIFSVFVFHTLNLIGLFYFLPLFQGVGLDYRLFWSAGYAANHFGIQKAYDIELLTSVQKNIFLEAGGNPGSFVFYPVYFLPVFLLPFRLLALFGLVPGYLIWIILNLFIILKYLHRFYSYYSSGNDKHIFYYSLISYPVIETLITGQVNVWLLVCLGEFLRSTQNNRAIQGDLWLAGLMIKPQLLLLAVPYMFWKRKWKELMGFSAGSIILLVSSLLIGGVGSFQSLYHLYVLTIQKQIYNDPQRMINWQMVGQMVDGVSGSTVSGLLIYSCIGLTVLGIAFFSCNDENHFEGEVFNWGIVFSATLLVSTVSHFHTAIMLLPLLLANHNHKGCRVLLAGYAVLPAMMILIIYLLAILENMGIIELWSTAGGNLLGLTGFGLTLGMYVFCGRRCNKFPRG